MRRTGLGCAAVGCAVPLITLFILFGTIGIVARARVRNLVPSAAALFAELRAAGLFVEDTLVRSVLRALGEES